MSRTRLVMMVCAFAAASLVAATVAQSSSKTTWYWDAGVCKSQLKNYQLQIGSGSNAPLLRSVAAYCVGLHNRCWLSDGVHRYKVFHVLILSKDNVVRSFQLTVTGKFSWTGSPLTIVAHGVTPSGFARVYGAEELAAAERQAALPCADPTSH